MRTAVSALCITSADTRNDDHAVLSPSRNRAVNAVMVPAWMDSSVYLQREEQRARVEQEEERRRDKI